MNKSDTTTLYMIRHGQTDWNLEQRWQGHADQPLNQNGLEQARVLAERFAGEPIAAVYSSDLQRARRTAEIIAARKHLPVVTDPRLREVNQGQWEGMQFSAIASQYPSELDHWQTDPMNARPPRGESGAEMVARLTACLDDIARLYPGQSVIVVSHGFSIAALRIRALKLPFAKTYFLAPPNAEPVILEWPVF